MKTVKKIANFILLFRISIIEIRIKSLHNRRYKLVNKLFVSGSCPAEVSKYFSYVFNPSCDFNLDSSEE